MPIVPVLSSLETLWQYEFPDKYKKVPDRMFRSRTFSILCFLAELMAAFSAGDRHFANLAR